MSIAIKKDRTHWRLSPPPGYVSLASRMDPLEVHLGIDEPAQPLRPICSPVPTDPGDIRDTFYAVFDIPLLGNGAGDGPQVCEGCSVVSSAIEQVADAVTRQEPVEHPMDSTYRRFDNETDDDLADWRGVMARGYCWPENQSKQLDPDLCEAMAIEALRVYRTKAREWEEMNAAATGRDHAAPR